MKIVVDQKSLKAALTFARSVSSVKTPQPILNTVLFSRAGKSLRLAATDLELAYTADVDASIDGDGSFALPGGEALARIAAMPDGDIRLEFSDHKVTFTAKGSRRKFELASFPGEEFPAVKRADASAPSLTLSCALISTMIEATRFAVSDDQSRPHLSSLLFRWSPGKLLMAATDGHRMAAETRDVEEIQSSGEFLIPLRAIGELRKILEAQDTVNVSTFGNTAHFVFSGVEFSTRTPEARFPPFEQLIPPRAQEPLRVRAKDLIDAAGAVSLAAGKSDNRCGIVVKWDGKELSLRAESADKGNASDVIACEYAGPKFTIGVDSTYIRQSLEGAAAEFVALSVAGELDPVRIEPWENPSSARQNVGIVMPMRV